jgi:hypothetical protein
MPVRSEYHFKEATAAIIAATGRGLEQAAEKEQENVESQYDSGADALGRAWTPLAPATIAAKGHDRILYERGDMRNSFYTKRTGPLSVVFGNSSNLLPYHEYGTEDIPRRPVLTPAKLHLEQEVIRSEVAAEIGKAIAALKFRAMF